MIFVRIRSGKVLSEGDFIGQNEAKSGAIVIIFVKHFLTALMPLHEEEVIVKLDFKYLFKDSLYLFFIISDQ